MPAKYAITAPPKVRPTNLSGFTESSLADMLAKVERYAIQRKLGAFPAHAAGSKDRVKTLTNNIASIALEVGRLEEMTAHSDPRDILDLISDAKEMRASGNFLLPSDVIEKTPKAPDPDNAIAKQKLLSPTQRRHTRRSSAEGHIYAIEFNNGSIKVGRTVPGRVGGRAGRLNELRRHALRNGVSPTGRTHESPETPRVAEVEARIHQALRATHPHFVGETYFDANWDFVFMVVNRVCGLDLDSPGTS